MSYIITFITSQIMTILGLAILGYIISQNKGEKPKGLMKLDNLSNVASDNPTWHLVLVVLGMILALPYNLVIYIIYFVAFILGYVGFVLNWVYTNIVLPVVKVAYKILCMITDIALMALRIAIRYCVTIPIDVFLSVINSVPAVLKWSSYRGSLKISLYGFLGYAVLEFIGFLFNQPLIGMLGGPLALVIAITWIVGKVSFGNDSNGKKAAIFAVSVIGVLLLIAGAIVVLNQSDPWHGWGGVLAGIWYSPSVIGVMTILVLLISVAFITNVGAIYINNEGANAKLTDNIKGAIADSFKRSWYFILQPVFVLLIGGILTFIPYYVMNYSADSLGTEVVNSAMSSTGVDLSIELKDNPSKMNEAMGDEVTDKEFTEHLNTLNREIELQRKIADNATFSAYINSTLPLMEIPSPVMSEAEIDGAIDAAKNNKEGLESAHKEAMKAADEQLKSMRANGTSNENIALMEQRKDRADKWMKAQISGAEDMLSYRESCATKYSLTYLAFLLGKAILFGVLLTLLINLYAYSVRPVYNMHRGSYLVAQVNEIKAKDRMQPWIGLVLIAMLAFGVMNSGGIMSKISSLIPSMEKMDMVSTDEVSTMMDGNENSVETVVIEDYSMDDFNDAMRELEDLESAEDEEFRCDDGQIVSAAYVDDGDCDCPNCEDEQ